MNCRVRLVLLASALFVCGCSRTSQPEGVKIAAPISPQEDESIPFEIIPTGASETMEWLCVYALNGKTAKFRVQLDGAKCSKEENLKDFRVCSGKGRFLAVPGSDSGQLLKDLKYALHAKSVPLNTKRVPILEFEYVSLGDHQSRLLGGGFTSKPNGDWTPMKLFLGEGDDEGEVFFNLNPVARTGEFSIKDEDYGDSVLTKLASVL